jgi:hypothetical protein
MEYLYKTGQQNVFFKKYDLPTKSVHYYLLVSGYLYFNDEGSIRAQRLMLHKLKWTFSDKTDIVPVDDFKNKQYFFIDRYHLEIDPSEKPVDYRKICHIREFFHSPKDGLFSTETTEKFVKYRKKEDRFHKDFKNTLVALGLFEQELAASCNNDVNNNINNNTRDANIRKFYSEDVRE